MMRKWMIYLFLIAAFEGMGQGLDTIMHYSIGTGEEESFVDFYFDEDSLLIFGNTGAKGNGNSDIYLAKLDSDFNPIWFRTIGSIDIEQLTHVVWDSLSDFGFLLGTNYNGFDGQGYNSFIYKIDSKGDLLDSIVFSSDQNIAFTASYAHKNGFIAILENGINESIPEAPTYYFIDSDLNVEQQKELSNCEGYTINSLTIGFNNHFYLLATDKNENESDRDVVVVEYDSIFNFLAEYQYGGSFEDRGEKIFKNSDTSLIVLSSSKSFGLNPEDFDMYLFSISNEGDTIWDYVYGNVIDNDPYDDIGADIMLVDDDRLLIGMTTESYGAGKKDFNLYRTLPEGDFFAGNSYGEIEDEILFKIDLRKGKYYLAGTTNSVGNGLTDIFIVTFDTIAFGNRIFKTIEDTVIYKQLSTEGQSLNRKGENLWVYSESKFQLASDVMINQVEIFDLTGRLISKSINRAGLRTCAAPDMTGIYLLFSIDSRGELYRQKIFVP